MFTGWFVSFVAAVDIGLAYLRRRDLQPPPGFTYEDDRLLHHQLAIRAARRLLGPITARIAAVTQHRCRRAAARKYLDPAKLQIVAVGDPASESVLKASRHHRDLTTPRASGSAADGSRVR